MSKALKDFLDIDKEQELLQSFTRLGVPSDDDINEESAQQKKGTRRNIVSSTKSRTANTTDRRKSVKFSDDVEGAGGAGKTGQRTNRIEAELRAARKRTEELMQKRKKPKENFVDFYTDKDRAAAVSAGEVSYFSTLAVFNCFYDFVLI